LTLKFCVDNNIELICIPPHTSHRLQPLDTHINMPLKRLWASVVKECIDRTDNNVQINNFQFLNLLQKVWPIMEDKRGVIVDSFKHCGIFPCKNTVQINEYKPSVTFFPSDNNPPAPVPYILRDEPDSVAIRKVIVSPKKKGKDIHRSEHVAELCSSENLEKRKQIYDRQSTKMTAATLTSVY